MYPMTDFLTGYMVPAGVGLAGDPGLKASQHSTGGALSVFETSIGAGPPLHSMTVRMSASTSWTARCRSAAAATLFGADAGSFVFLPRGRPHRFWAAGPSARLLLIAVPGGIEDYFHQINAAASDDERARIAERFGIRVVAE